VGHVPSCASFRFTFYYLAVSSRSGRGGVGGASESRRKQETRGGWSWSIRFPRLACIWASLGGNHHFGLSLENLQQTCKQSNSSRRAKTKGGEGFCECFNRRYTFAFVWAFQSLGAMAAPDVRLRSCMSDVARSIQGVEGFPRVSSVRAGLSEKRWISESGLERMTWPKRRSRLWRIRCSQGGEAYRCQHFHCVRKGVVYVSCPHVGDGPNVAVVGHVDDTRCVSFDRPCLCRVEQ